MKLGWRVYAVIRNVLLTAGAVIGGVCVVIFALGMLLGVKPAIVVSGSMLPTIPIGAMTFSLERSAAELEVGDIVMIERPDDRGLVTHRIVAMEKSGESTALTLQGDNNDTTDPEPYLVKKAAVVAFTVPGLGYLADFLQRQGILVGVILLSVVAALLVLDPAKLGRRHDAGGERESETASPSESETATSAAGKALVETATDTVPTMRVRSRRRALRKEKAR